MSTKRRSPPLSNSRKQNIATRTVTSQIPEEIKPKASPVEKEHERSQHSPTKTSRRAEKEVLANLNDRFACYIDKVRHLELENSRLRIEKQSNEEELVREINSVKLMYDKELVDLRKLIDDISKEKAELELDSTRLYDESLYLKGQLNDKTAEYDLLQRNLNDVKKNINDVKPKMTLLKDERDRLEEQKKALEQETKKLAAQVVQLKKEIDEETLRRIEAENSQKTLQEDMAFKLEMFQQQLNEAKESKTDINISLIKEEMDQEFNHRLLNELQSIRDKYESDFEKNKAEIEVLYEEKIVSLQNHLERVISSRSIATEEMKNLSSKNEQLNSIIAQVEHENAQLNAQIRQLEKEIETNKSIFLDEIKKYEEELDKLRHQMGLQVTDYQDLMDIKIALDMEISAYRKLLEGEEARLNMAQSAQSSSVPVKRRKKNEGYSEGQYKCNEFVLFRSSICDLKLDACPKGSYIKVTNKGKSNFNLFGCRLIRGAEGATVSYTFKLKAFKKILPDQSVTIWSSNVNQTHKPPNNIVLETDVWPISNVTSTILLNERDEEIARVKHKMTYEESPDEKDKLLETTDLSQDNEPSSSWSDVPQDEKCSIM